ncbi:MAG: peptidoglycan recognition family protein [Lachnospiraceae bacterium]
MNQRKRKRPSKARRHTRIQVYMKLGIVLLILLTVVLGAVQLLKPAKYSEKKGADIDAAKPAMDVQLLDVNEYSRPGLKSGKINGIVIHYTANPGATAQQNRDYFQGLKDSHETKVSSHFIVGLDGEIIQCIPTWEIAYASNKRNEDTVSMECCHPDTSGKFNDQTYRSMVQLTAWLCKKFDLTEKDVIRHYDITGKICPKYFVDHENAWEAFRADVKTVLGKME